MQPTAEKVKYTIELTTEMDEIVNYLQKKLQKSSRADVLRTAILLLKFVQDQREAGFTIGVVTRPNGQTELKVERVVELIG